MNKDIAQQVENKTLETCNVYVVFESLKPRAVMYKTGTSQRLAGTDSGKFSVPKPKGYK